MVTIGKYIRNATDALATTRPEFANTPFAPHDFRRLLATELVNNGLPIHIGAALLGHLNTHTTRGYVAVFNEDVIAHYQGMLRNALADTTTSTPVLVRALFEQMGAGIQEDQRFYRGVFREIAKIRLGLDEGGLGEQAGRAALELLVKLLARGQERGDLSRALRAEDLASAFDSLVNGTITHWLYGDAAEPLKERMKRSADVFLGAAAVGPAAGRSARRPTLAPRRPRRRA